VNPDDRPLGGQSASDLRETERTVHPAAQGRIIPAARIPAEHVDEQLPDRRHATRLGEICDFMLDRVDVESTIHPVPELGAVLTCGFTPQQVEKRSPHALQAAKLLPPLQLLHQDRLFEWTAVPLDGLGVYGWTAQHLHERVGDQPARTNARSFDARRRPQR
jgi:hypothetical protein